MKINLKVIDIYHDDAVSDLAKTYASGIRGIIHKASEGLSIIDRAYPLRRKKTEEAGLLCGAYHFIRPGEPERQADAFFDYALPDDQTLLALDHEDRAVPLSDAVKFMKAIEGRAKRKPVIYSGFLLKEQIGAASEEDKAYLASCRLWLAQYVHVGTQPTWPQIWKAPWLWQYSDGVHGQAAQRIPGIDNPADLNSFAGTDEELAQEWAGEKEI